MFSELEIDLCTFKQHLVSLTSGTVYAIPLLVGTEHYLPSEHILLSTYN